MPTILAKALDQPQLPRPPDQWSPEFQAALHRELNTFFRQLVSAGAINAGSLNINIKSLPTQADLATLRSGDVYRDTTASQVLKVKP